MTYPRLHDMLGWGRGQPQQLQLLRDVGRSVVVYDGGGGGKEVFVRVWVWVASSSQEVLTIRRQDCAHVPEKDDVKRALMPKKLKLV